ncbi:hypothetical protein ACWEQV_28405 [Rhodococcus aetherivorans]|uniref:hypothetical protein n=1 Tax=Rhodococcus aetherivorans TaxID=191292 RepID=UPI00045CCF1E|nr:hypothetical protein [Rhodococcus aetherivorans]KDE11630.1 hypothetical protein N505_0118550 [Rhodococcus aetherivorans]MDV6293942.1 hypothetical protein [Rhodococcus aetherivorans]
MQSVLKKTAVAVAGVGALALCVSGTAFAAGNPSVAAAGTPGSVTVDFDFAGVDVADGVTCVTYVSTMQSGLDAADPSGRADAQAPGSKFSVENTSTSAITFVQDGKPVSQGPQPIAAGTYYVYWGCQDAAGTQWDNVGLKSGAPFQNPIIVNVAGDAAVPAQIPVAPSAQSAPTKSEGAVPQAEAAPETDGIIDTPEELIGLVIDIFGDQLPDLSQS